LHRFQVESQIDAIHSPIVQLRSGGYVVINQTEALVAIDVNSGRSTRERNIEETALRTNLEAAEEIARQLRLRDLAGLIVIDFIDMEEHRNQGAVERRLKDALKSDRARIQVGRISPFGLLEMSRQRLRPSLVEASTQPCPHCGGTGFIRSTESTALYVLRSIEEEGMRRRAAEVCVYVPTTVALYILNHKRDSLAQLETRYGIRVLVARDDALIPPAFRLERLRALEPGEAAAAVPAPLTQEPEIEADEPEEDTDETVESDDAERPEPESEEERVRARRRRRRRRRHEDERSRAPSSNNGEEAEEPAIERVAVSTPEADAEPDDEDDDAGRLRRRRGRRGGRRRGRREEGPGASLEIGSPATDTVEIVASDVDNSADDASEFSEIRPAVANGEPALAATEIETASLAAFAGDGIPAEELPPAPPPTAATEGDVEASYPSRGEEPPGNGASSLTGLEKTEPARAPQTIATAVEEQTSYAQAREESPGNGASSPTEQEEAMPVRSPRTIATAAENQPAYSTTAEELRANGTGAITELASAEPPSGGRLAERPEDAREAASPVLGSESAPETGAAATAPSETAQVVQEITKKPENPRRGWWQRLIQS
jgi:ribonuclease E